MLPACGRRGPTCAGPSAGTYEYPLLDQGTQAMTEENTQQDAQALAASRAGKYLTFFLADEEYGLEILRVREIIGIMDITTVPRTPEFVKGVINLRGKVIPVLDLRLKFNMPEAERTEETCVIVVQVDEVEIGIIVDKVSEVLDITADAIDDAPQFGTDINTDFILGMGKSEDRVTILLDISKVLAGTDLESMGL
jgi:purine-binding chemotaxis protein CheW